MRRFELHGVERGVSVFDDYAHHPTEVAAALVAARTVVGGGRIIAIQQPHTYSRTQQMYREFAEVLEQHADHTVMLDVYGAREDPVPGVTGELVSDAFEDPAHVHSSRTGRQAADYTATIARDGDYVITLGCGNVYQIIPQVLEALSHTPDAAAEAASDRFPLTTRPPAQRVAPDAPADAPSAARGAADGCGGRFALARRRRRGPCDVDLTADAAAPAQDAATPAGARRASRRSSRWARRP